MPQIGSANACFGADSANSLADTNWRAPCRIVRVHRIRGVRKLHVSSVVALAEHRTDYARYTFAFQSQSHFVAMRAVCSLLQGGLSNEIVVKARPPT
jgi:hypothetical protein